MAQKLSAPLPPDLDLTAPFQVVLTALGPADGSLVSGVNVSNVAIIATNAIPDSATDETPLPLPLPLFVPIPDDEEVAAA